MSHALILAPQKTGTCLATAICNSMAGTHFLFEIDFSKSLDHDLKPRLVAFLTAFPDAAGLFGSGPGMKEPLARFSKIYPKMAEQFPRVLGAKVITLDPSRIENNLDLPVIFTMRDIRTWICKNLIIIQNPEIAENIAPAASNFVEYVITTFLHPQALRLRMEDMLLDGGMRWADQISGFLGGSQGEARAWHERREKVCEDSSAYSNWAEIKDLAFAVPTAMDTVSECSNHPFWEELLPIFAKYYGSPDGRFSAAEIASDRNAVRNIGQSFKISLQDAFERNKSHSFRFGLTSASV